MISHATFSLASASALQLGEIEVRTMGFARTAGLGLLASAATMTARKATRSMMHTRYGAPRLPRAARQNNGFAMILALAAGAGMMLALADVLQERRKQATRAET